MIVPLASAGLAASLLISSANALASQRDPNELINSIVKLQESYKYCLIQQTVEIGSANEEPAETILRAVAATCRPKELELRAAYAESPLPAAHVEGLMIRDKKIGEDAGVAALLRVRASHKKP